MSADFYAGYISGAAGIVLGNPLDVLKVRLQAGHRHTLTSALPNLPTRTTTTTTTKTATTTTTTTTKTKPPLNHILRPFLLGTAAPVLGYGALNALLFVSYNRTEAFLNSLSFPSSASSHPLSGTEIGTGTESGNGNGTGSNLLTTWLAGAVGGLATWVVSTPTELVKCRAQLQVSSSSSSSSGGNGAGSGSGGSVSSWQITKQLLRAEGVRGLFRGGGVTALRDSVGYGFYFWGYELCSRGWVPKSTGVAAGEGTATATTTGEGGGILSSDAARVLLCGGAAGVITWASIFPLDVIKTRVQTQVLGGAAQGGERTGAWEVARETYRQGGARPFFRGLGVCSVRAFFVNAVQWGVYEWVMRELGQGRARREGVGEEVVGVVPA